MSCQAYHNITHSSLHTRTLCVSVFVQASENDSDWNMDVVQSTHTQDDDDPDWKRMGEGHTHHGGRHHRDEENVTSM